MDKAGIQERVDHIPILHIKGLHTFEGVPESWRPWEAELSPSALYNCSLPCRKKMNLKAPEVKWMSIKRWVSKTPEGIYLPDGVYLSIKRLEKYMVDPEPRITKQEFILMMFPYGNVWSQIDPEVPITEEWLYSDSSNGNMILEELMRKDAAYPIQEYFENCYIFMEEHPDQVGIHLKRKKNTQSSRDATRIVEL